MKQLSLLILTLFACTLSYAQDAVEKITFSEDFYATIEKASKEKKVTVVYFTATWCGWCKRMKSTTFSDQRVLDLASQVEWVSVDLDKHRTLAAMFGVRGVPHTYILNQDGEVLTNRSGFISAQDMAGLLREYKDKAQAEGFLDSVYKTYKHINDVVAAGPTHKEYKIVVYDVIKKLASPTTPGQMYLKTQLSRSGKHALPLLIKALGEEQLAVRAAASDLLAQMTKKEIDFDPFAAKAVRVKQVEAIQALLSDQLKEDKSVEM